jgi:phospholipase/carboxylesterase
MRHLLLLAALAALLIAPAGCRGVVDPPAPTEPGETVAVATDDAVDIDEPRLDYLERYTGGAGEGDTLPMVIAIHGRGDTPEAFSRLVEGWGTPARVIVPRGLHPFERTGGSTWFLAGTRDAPEALGREVGQAADAVAELVRALLAERPTVGKPVVTGFSQGGMLSYTLAVRHPDLFAGAVPVSGFLPEVLVPAAAVAAAPVRALHGTADTMIPPELSRGSAEALKALGLDASLAEYEGVAHSISPEMRRDLFANLDALAGGDGAGADGAGVPSP